MNTETSIIREVTINYKKTKKANVNISSSEDVARFIRKTLPNNSQEHFVVLHLSGANNIISYHIPFSGTANSCNVHPREIFQGAITQGAIAIIIAHNHPSNSVKKSKDDDLITKKIKECGDILGVKLLDHIIITDTESVSYNDLGLL